LPAIEIISTRKAGKRVSPSRVFTEYIRNETGVCEWEWEWLTALRVVIASHIGTASYIGITS